MMRGLCRREATMLVLTVKCGEEVVIGSPSYPAGTIKVVEIGAGRVKLGITMPLGVGVNRRVVADRIVAKAAQSGGQGAR